MSTTAASIPIRSIDDQALRRFGSIFIDPAAGCLECRTFKTRKVNGFLVRSKSKWPDVHCGWFDRVDSLVVEASRLRSVAAYACLNPADPCLMEKEETRNQLAWVKDATVDKKIVCLRWLYIDIDPKRDPDISSTDEELKAALSRRDAILGDYPELLRSALWGCSGNGGFIWIRLPDYPNDRTHKRLVERMLAALSRRYSDQVVIIDTKTKNPSRVGPLPGTWKTKGPDTPERPWRLVTLDCPIDGRGVTP